SPHFIKDGLPLNDLILARDQRHQHSKLFTRERNRPAKTADPDLVKVDRQSPVVKVHWRTAVDSPEYRSDARNQLLQRERLCDIVVSAHIEAFDLLCLRSLCRENDDRNFFRGSFHPESMT